MFASARKAFLKYLEVGSSDEKGRDANQQLFVSNLFSFIGYTITLILAFSAAIRGNALLSIALFVASSVFFFCHHVHRFPQLGNTILISTRLIFTSLFVLMLYLVYSGGVAHTGPLWIYIVPPVAFFFSGLGKGLKSLAAFTIIMAIMLLYPNEVLLGTTYTLEFKTRLLYSFLTVTLLFGFYEYSRQKSYDDIQELSQKNEQLAMSDPLTRLLNRRGMRTHLDHEYSRLQRSKEPLSVLLCDIDHFKHVNDKYFHDGGDFVLESLSAFFVQQIRQQDIVARWGGEEFLFLLPNTNSNDAFLLAEKIRKQVENETIHYKNNAIKVTLSIGVNEVKPNESVDQAINNADHLLYLAKNRGRNQTVASNMLVPEKQTG
jgi:diguanylate cyclase (GGDEF)-like protein